MSNRLTKVGRDLGYRSGWVPLFDDVDASGASSITFATLPSKVQAVELSGWLVTSVAGAHIYLQVAHGGVFETTNYLFTQYYVYNSAGSPAPGIDASASPYYLASTTYTGSGGGFFFRVCFPDVTFTGYQRSHGELFAHDNNNLNIPDIFFNISVGCQVIGAIDGFKILPSSGTVSGRVSITGRYLA